MKYDHEALEQFFYFLKFNRDYLDETPDKIIEVFEDTLLKVHYHG